ncbi:hypothetical protein AAEO56_08445 [Flavobacterium sp. DGU11]|uniref:Uncharacterized protein n=1 Tax=Flavobacterium arundinis TaxID=3139143 RepID=A0ABU9HWV7_9FLAO
MAKAKTHEPLPFSPGRSGILPEARKADVAQHGTACSNKRIDYCY